MYLMCIESIQVVYSGGGKGGSVDVREKWALHKIKKENGQVRRGEKESSNLNNKSLEFH